MKKSDKKFILKLVKKEVFALTFALEVKIKANLQREMNYFRIHLQHNINKVLMKIVPDKKIYQWNFLNTSLNFKRLAKTIKIRLRYNLKL